MTNAIGKPELARMFAAAAMKVRAEHQRLSQLDSLAGDGDHGTTMLRVVEQMEKIMHRDSPSPENVSTLLRDTGWGVMSVDGGASSALLGSFFTGMSDGPIDATSVGCKELAEAFEAGLRAMAKVTQSKPGDKTMMDALCPAVAAFRAAAAQDENVTRALGDAAAAAEAGADSTKNFVARFGRAKFLGQKTIGSPDAGAVSAALLFSGFYEGFSREGNS